MSSQADNPDRPLAEIDPESERLLAEVARRMGTAEVSALRQSLYIILALYDGKIAGGQPVIRYRGAEQLVNLPNTA